MKPNHLINKNDWIAFYIPTLNKLFLMEYVLNTMLLLTIIDTYNYLI